MARDDTEQQVTKTGAPRTRPSEIIVRAVLTLLLIGLISWILLGNVSNLEEVGEALKGSRARPGSS